MKFNLGEYQEQDQRVSQILAQGDEMGGYWMFLQDQFFNDPLKGFASNAGLRDPKTSRILNRVGIDILPNETYVNPIKMGLLEKIALITKNGNPLAVKAIPNEDTAGSLETFKENEQALKLAAESPIRCTPSILGIGVDLDTGKRAHIRTLEKGEEINMLAVPQKRNSLERSFDFDVFPNFFTLDAGIGNPIQNINYLIRLQRSEMGPPLTKYFLSKLIALRTIMTASTAYQEESGQVLALTPKDLRFCTGDAMGFSTNNILDLRAVAFPGYLKIPSFDSLLNQVRNQEDTAFLEDGLSSPLRLAIGMIAQVPESMPNRPEWITNIIAWTVKGIFENLPDQRHAAFKNTIMQLVGSGKKITLEVVKNATSPYTQDAILDADNRYFGTRRRYY